MIKKLDIKKQFDWSDRDTKDLELWDIVHEWEGGHCNFDQRVLVKIIETLEEKLNETIQTLNLLSKALK
mgnify:CR=1 FL=1